MSKRRLQDYRAEGLFSHTHLKVSNGRTKCYYDATEIEAILEKNKVNMTKKFPSNLK